MILIQDAHDQTVTVIPIRGLAKVSDQSPKRQDVGMKDLLKVMITISDQFMWPLCNNTGYLMTLLSINHFLKSVVDCSQNQF